MKLSVTTWSFPQLSLKEVGGLASVLGLDGIDVGLFYASALDKQKILTSPDAYGAEVAQTAGVPVANYYHLFGDGLAERNLALPQDPQNLEDLNAVLRFAKAAGAPSIFILPGLINPGQSRREAFNASAAALRPLVEAGQAEGVAVTIEPHVHGLIESVDMVHEIVDKVPGLKITLDLAHFVSLGFRQDEIETLAPYAGHVHLRQAKQGHLQSKTEEGTINFASLLGALRDARYVGWLAIEYVHQAYMNTLYDDVLTETVKMRDLVRDWQSK
ncbi:sugar phosphate isomerase/epimerase family protein [Pelagibacterium sp.]|uniref:sugar phosphate isomerase/epimerase family protein n=1 Tax=Pelagibacterium sp. TaxID=1967288 RepID=UPI003BAAC4B9